MEIFTRKYKVNPFTRGNMVLRGERFKPATEITVETRKHFFKIFLEILNQMLQNFKRIMKNLFPVSQDI